MHGKYARGSLVTWGGSLWLCLKDTEDRPKTTDDWKVVARHGRDADGRAPKDA
jgi:hypothetical protein